VSPLPRKSHPAVTVAASGLLLAVVYVCGQLALLLPAVPLLLLLVSLLAGCYPGCDAILRLAERAAASPRPLRAERQRRPTPPRSHPVRGGLLIAFGLAQRPPPLTS
jgi:hypothetical protein